MPVTRLKILFIAVLAGKLLVLCTKAALNVTGVTVHYQRKAEIEMG